MIRQDILRFFLFFLHFYCPRNREGHTDRQNRDARRLRELEAEIRALRKKLEEKDGVIDILKKSVGILSKP